MRSVFIGEREIKLRANILALTYYEQEFNSSLLDDFASVADGAESMGKELDFGKLRLTDVLKMTYALNKASTHPSNPFPSFLEWQYDLNIDLTNFDWYTGVIDEITEGFFRSAGALGRAEQAAKKKAGETQKARPDVTSEPQADGI